MFPVRCEGEADELHPPKKAKTGGAAENTTKAKQGARGALLPTIEALPVSSFCRGTADPTEDDAFDDIRATLEIQCAFFEPVRTNMAATFDGISGGGKVWTYTFSRSAVPLPNDETSLDPGDMLVIETPGGGGFGSE